MIHIGVKSCLKHLIKKKKGLNDVDAKKRATLCDSSVLNIRIKC